MYCKNCGFKSTEGEKYCKNCGKELVSVSENNNINIQNNNINEYKNKKLQKKKKYWLIPVMLFLSFILSSLIYLIIRVYMDGTISMSTNTSAILTIILHIISFLQILSGLLVVPGIIVAIILSAKQPNEKVISYDNSINNNLDIKERLLMAYIGNNYDKIIKQKFSISAFFFSLFYMMYRKLIFPSIITYVLIYSLSFFVSESVLTLIIFVFGIILGFVFNKFYVSYCKNQIINIRKNNPNKNEDELLEMCRKKGRTNIAYPFIISFIWMILVGVLNMLIGNVYTDKDFVTEYNSEYELSYGIPKGFEIVDYAYSEDDKKYYFRKEDSEIEQDQICEIKVELDHELVKTLYVMSEYTDENGLISSEYTGKNKVYDLNKNDELEKYMNEMECDNKVKTQDINGIDWKYCSKDNKYYYRTTYIDSSYLVSFREDKDICSGVKDKFINSLQITKKNN